MKKGLLLIGVMMLTVVTAFGQRRWTLQECLDYAMANNLSLQKTKLSKTKPLTPTTAENISTQNSK